MAFPASGFSDRTTASAAVGAPRPATKWLVPGVGALVGLACGSGAFFRGFYSFSTWAVLELIALLSLMVFVVVTSERQARLALLAPAALAALAGVQLLSALWAESVSQALTDAHRVALYAAMLALLIPMASKHRGRVALIGGVAAGSLLLGVYEASRLLSREPPEDFLQGRLQDPLGYVNGMAAALFLGFWALLGAAEGARSRRFGALALAGASFLASLGVLVQSRGAVAALLLSVAAVLVLLPGRDRRAALLVVLGVGLVFSWSRLTQVYESFDRRTGLPSPGATREAVIAAALAALACGLAWLVIGRLRPAGRRALHSARWRQVAPAVVGGLVVIGCAVGLAAGASEPLKRRWDDFRSLNQPSSGARLGSTGGNRYDYWRIALDQFRDDPWRGVGAGNFDSTYFLQRRTSEDVRQPHSLPLQTLAETGLPGFAALLLFLVAVGSALARARPAARKVGADRGLMVAATGIFSYWIFHTSVDWLHLLPALTGCALIAVGTLVGMAAWPPTGTMRLRVRPLVFAAAVLVAASSGILVLAERSRTEARSLLASNPTGALDAAQRAVRLDDEALPGYFVLASAQAGLDRYQQARATLQEARRREPRDWLPPALLGDLAIRRRDYALAAADYGTAARLNPRSIQLRTLAADAARRAP